MKVGTMDEKEAETYVCNRLNEVKEILDDIARKTGIVFVCFGEEFATVFGSLGMDLITGLNNIMKVVPDRLELANKAKDAAFTANLEAKGLQERRKEMRSILDALIARSEGDLKTELECLIDKYGAFDVKEKK